MSKRTRKPRAQRLRIVKSGEKVPLEVQVKLPPPPKPGELARRPGVPIELHLRDPIQGPDGKYTSVLIEGQGADWSFVSVLARHDEKSAILTPAYQIQMLDKDGVGFVVTVPFANVIGARMPVYTVPEPEEDAPAPPEEPK